MGGTGVVGADPLADDPVPRVIHRPVDGARRGNNSVLAAAIVVSISCGVIIACRTVVGRGAKVGRGRGVCDARQREVEQVGHDLAAGVGDPAVQALYIGLADRLLAGGCVGRAVVGWRGAGRECFKINVSLP